MGWGICEIDSQVHAGPRAPWTAEAIPWPGVTCGKRVLPVPDAEAYWSSQVSFSE
jgi:hypothetical protein